ncbi:MAG: ABC transporter ATP-binding protein [Anaerolineales bacterium]
MAPIVQATSLRKSYHMGEVDVEALRGVDFVVEPGEFVAIMGPSGSGKSSLLHILGGLDDSSGGEVSLAGQSLGQMDDNELTLLRRRQVGFVFQFFNLLPTLSATENVALPLLLEGASDTDTNSNAQEMLALVGLDDRADHLPDQLSGGEQQRVALARALVTEPVVVLADEPTGNLDRRSGIEILTLLRLACDEKDQTIVIVTHDPFAASRADRVVFLQDGELVRKLDLMSVAEPVDAIVSVMGELEL